MITGFKHKGLRRFYETGSKRGIKTQHADRLQDILTDLSAAEQVTDLKSPGYFLHPLKGARKGEWSVRVAGNWRVTFKFDGKSFYNLDYEDYH